MNLSHSGRAQVLVEALPYIQRYYGKTIVVKYGGNAMVSDELRKAVISDIILLKLVGINVVVVHGGGPEISEMLKKTGKESRFVNGLRYTDEETMDVVQKVQFDSAFTFLYSKRTGTPAAAMEGQVPEEMVKDRFQRLLKEVQEIAAKKAESLTGKVEPVLVEEVNGQDEALVTGRLSGNFVVHLPGDSSMVGKILPVKLKECKGFYFYGEMTESFLDRTI